MPYLIDGHNLIGQMPGIDLADPEDEARLTAALAAFAARTGREVHVYFDRRAPGAPRSQRQGRLHLRFVTPPRTADDAIRDHLRQLGSQAQNWTVVSSDREVQRAAHRAGARVVSSTTFSRELRAGQRGPAAADTEKPEGVQSPEELAYWEELFRLGSERDPPEG